MQNLAAAAAAAAAAAGSSEPNETQLCSGREPEMGYSSRLVLLYFTSMALFVVSRTSQVNDNVVYVSSFVAPVAVDVTSSVGLAPLINGGLTGKCINIHAQIERKRERERMRSRKHQPSYVVSFHQDEKLKIP